MGKYWPTAGNLNFLVGFYIGSAVRQIIPIDNGLSLMIGAWSLTSYVGKL